MEWSGKMKSEGGGGGGSGGGLVFGTAAIAAVEQGSGQEKLQLHSEGFGHGWRRSWTFVQPSQDRPEAASTATTTTDFIVIRDVEGGRRGTIDESAAAATAAAHIPKELHFLKMDDDDDDTQLPSYQQQQQQQLHLYSEEHHAVAAEQKQLKVAVKEEEEVDDDDEEEDEDDEDVEDDEGEEDKEEEDAIDDDEDEDEDEDKDEDEEGEDGGDQEQHNYEQDFKLEQGDQREGATLKLLNGSSNGSGSFAGGLVNLIAPQPQQPVERVKGLLQVGVDNKPNARDDWTEPATHSLLEAWGERYLQLNKGNLKQEDWEEVAVVVSGMSKIHKTDVQCKNRLDTLKKKYKVEKHKQSAIGSSDSKWPFYKQLDKLLSAPAKRVGIPGAVDAGQPVKYSALDFSRGEHFTRVMKLEADAMKETRNNASTCSKSKESPNMTFSSPHAPGTDGIQSNSRKRKAVDTPFKTLAKAITKFGEIYEKMEQSKQQQLMDLEKIRMEFTRDLELQRMQLFMQTQLELAKMKHGDNDMEATVSNVSG